MNSALTAAQRYTSLGEHTRNAKDLEYEVILGVTRDLSKHTGSDQADFPALVSSLNKNERLWIEIGTQVADPSNQLEAGLRARLFYLAGFVRHQTTEILSGKAGIESLIELNVAVLRGLKGTR
ncbi:MAG: flagellar biosynthesis regulator FlaF [Planktotalea sp.]|uniref:flagellar biosynthesis regulator FlaF n=1 Tax=Planktotalea sp. TaxID=2029877 RepID=UPI003C773C80